MHTHAHTLTVTGGLFLLMTSGLNMAFSQGYMDYYWAKPYAECSSLCLNSDIKEVYCLYNRALLFLTYSPQFFHFPAAFGQHGGRGESGEEEETQGKQLIRFWQRGPNICFKQKTSAYFTFIFHNLQKQPAKI